MINNILKTREIELDFSFISEGLELEKLLVQLEEHSGDQPIEKQKKVFDILEYITV